MFTNNLYTFFRHRTLTCYDVMIASVDARNKRKLVKAEVNFYSRFLPRPRTVEANGSEAWVDLVTKVT